MSLLGFLGAGVSALGSALGFGSAKASNKSNERIARQTNEANAALAAQQNEYNQQLQSNEFAFNKQQSEDEYARNLEQWNLENEYNSPSQQVARYQAAGLNPNLIYGTGSASAGNASTSPQFTAAKYNAPKAERSTAQGYTHRPVFQQTDPFQAISIGQQLAQQKAQINAVNAQADYTRQQTINSALESASRTFDIDFKKDTRELAMEQLYETLQKTRSASSLDWQRADHEFEKANLTRHQQDIAKQALKNLSLDHNIKSFELKLAKVGITNRDGLLTRILGRVFANSLSSKGQQFFNF